MPPPEAPTSRGKTSSDCTFVSSEEWCRSGLIPGSRSASTHLMHVRARSRTVGREECPAPAIHDGSAVLLADRLVASGTSPSQRVLLDERRTQVREALERLASNDREVLLMVYLEGLTVVDVAAILGITAGATKVRHLRALDRIRKDLDDGAGSSGQ